MSHLRCCARFNRSFDEAIINTLPSVSEALGFRSEEGNSAATRDLACRQVIRGDNNCVYVKTALLPLCLVAGTGLRYFLSTMLRVTR